MMVTASVAELKARLSAYLALVAGGADVVVTDRGTPIARLTPLGVPEATDARVARLLRLGLADGPGDAIPEEFWRRPRPVDAAGRSLGALLEERGADR